MPKIIWNTNIIPAENPCINSNDRGFTLGHGLFETILVNKGTIPVLNYHWQRLETSSAMIGIPLPFTFLQLETMIKNLIEENHLQGKVATSRVTLTHGESERGILPRLAPRPNFLISVFECMPATDKPLDALIVKTRKNEHSLSSQIKSLSYLDNILAQKEAITAGYDEAILLNSLGNIADGAISTIFMVKNRQIMTPGIRDGALPGVIRAVLLKELKHEFSFVEKTITPEDLMQADELFLTNALRGIKTVHKVNHKTFPCFETSTRIQKALQERKGYI